MCFLFKFGAGCIVAIVSLRFPMICLAAPTADEVVQTMQSVDSARELGKVFWGLFQNCNDDQLKRLKAHSNHGVAIQASWEQLRRAIDTLPKKKSKEEEWEFVDPNSLHRFLGFIEGRLHLTIPCEWEKEMLLATAIPGDPVSLAPGSAPQDDRPTPYYDTNNKMQTATGLQLYETDDAISITRNSDRMTFQFSRAVLEDAAKEYKFIKDSFYDGDSGEKYKINLIATDQKYFIVYHGIQYDGRYPLFCFKKGESKLQWTTEVIGFEGGGGLTGANFYHWTIMKVSGDHVIVFGAGHISMYIEAFSISNGSCLFRFNTSYGEE